MRPRAEQCQDDVVSSRAGLEPISERLGQCSLCAHGTRPSLASWASCGWLLLLLPCWPGACPVPAPGPILIQDGARVAHSWGTLISLETQGVGWDGVYGLLPGRYPLLVAGLRGKRIDPWTLFFPLNIQLPLVQLLLI